MELMTVQTQAGLRLMCEWFVMCGRPAEWGALGPDRTYLPICQRCADRVGFKPEELATYELSGPWNEEA